MSEQSPDLEQEDLTMSTFDHLMELRKRIIVTLIIFVIALIIGSCFQ